MNKKPSKKPNNPNFSSGPCAKHPGFTLDALKDAPLGRSHRSVLGKSKLQESIEKTKEILGVPKDYLVGIVPASDTGAIEMAMWNLLGERGIDVIHFDAFGKSWATDIIKELKLENVREFSADYGKLPDITNIECNNDIVFTWNGTTSGVKIPDADFISDKREGLAICDATSAVFAMDIPWKKLDVITFSWQKVLGGEAGHGMLIMSPRAVKRLESYSPKWPIPKIFQMKKDGKIAKEIFEGSTINTPSMLCNEDYLDALRWSESIGGLPGLIKRSMDNFKMVESFVKKHPWIDFLAIDPVIRSNTSVCLTIDLPTERRKKMLKLMEEEKAAYDINSYKTAPEGIRIWCGATVEKQDVEMMLLWLEWAYNEVN
ncbi:phosphoserine transaminase [uncultured Ilyobacter sp.]|uniref:phosphoserine transaminase n=1 Tax=uncultured Ilyobacter sp. TaxID=544433 RepID=UPI0029C60A20|nr:phosphoserine transaminase [uncultured Ilyobacter sp.]